MSRKKDGLTWVLILGVLLLVGTASFYVLWPQLQPHATIHLGDGVFTAKVAKAPEERAKGLGGTHSLGDDQALLLVYTTDGKWPVSMKDMTYPIDIVWLDKDKKVVYIVKNVPPESYPYEQFEPKNEARYVVELAEGVVGQKKITIGATALFDENNLEGIKL
ncbi:MAG TPA: DUF192 domain-containing protein [Candidatus Saccharimonadales bacterium]|nr:DUF192 domain-containing protein [Candidatus Saccharimonadales bacterium]